MFIFDFLLTVISTKIGYATEINPIINTITPYGAVAINLGIRFLLLRRFTRVGFTLVCFRGIAYLTANINHIQLLRAYLSAFLS